MRVEEAMSSPVVAIRPSEPIARAKNLMLRHRIKRLVVVERGEPVGVLTMRNLAERLSKGAPAWRRRPLDLIPVSRVMTKGLITCNVGTELPKAADLMLKHGISGLIIVEGKRLAGILTKTDLTRHFADHLKRVAKVGELMTKDVVTVGRRHSLARVAELMEERGISRVVVEEAGKPIGIITARDVAFAQLERPAEGLGEQKVRFTRKAERVGRPRYRYVKYVALLTAEDVMRREPIVVGAGADAAEAAGLMLRHGISGLPVIEEGALVGIITKTDLTKGVAQRG